MNKILSVLFAVFVGLFAVGCGGEDPKDIAVDFVKTMHSGNAKDVMKFFDLDELDPNQKQMFEGKLMMGIGEVGKKVSEKGGVSDVKAGEVKVAEDSADVEVTTTFKDKSNKKEIIRLAKNKDGKWKIRFK